jgi:hypothetical protein
LLRRGAAVGVAGATAWAAPAVLTIDRAGAAGSGAGDLATTNGTVEVGQPGVNTLLLTFDITGAGGPFTLANNTDPQLPPETAQMTVAAGCVYFPGGGVAYFAGAATCDPTDACPTGQWLYVQITAGGPGVGSFRGQFVAAGTCPNASNVGVVATAPFDPVISGTLTVSP